MRRLIFTVTSLLCATVQAFAADSVGGNAPNTAVQNSFIEAFYRGSFSTLVLLPPTSNVESFGSPGLEQTFQWAANKSLTAALVAPDSTGTITLQMYPDLYTYYSTIGGAGTAGYPTSDTIACPIVAYGTCDFQLFSKDYALFVYSNPSGVSYSVTDPFYTEWINGGGIGGPVGPVISATASVTSQAGTAGTQQLFAEGAISSYTPTGATAASTYTVSGSIYTAYANAGGLATVGFPTAEQTLLASGQLQQTFENGRILSTPGGATSVLFPIATIAINNVPSSLTLNLGETATLTATVTDTLGNIVTGRTLNWSTSNGSAVALQVNGYTATVTAVGGGSAAIQATGERVASAPVLITVVAPCCAIGAGAPNQTISQAFQAAAARNGLSVLLPNPTPVVRNGGGYIQTLTAANGSGAIYVIAESDQSAVAYVIAGALYAAYLADGGFAGPLGYPASDASAGGTQSFASGAALAGSPVRLVPVPIAAKWIASGAETGPLGAQAGNSTAFTSLSGINGNSQTFAGGAIFGIASGSGAGQAFISTGLILARYVALSGPSGLLGVPLSDIFTSGVALRQNFETGYIDLQPGATAAVEHYNPRKPAVTAVPGMVAPGGKVQIAISGFAFGAALVVSVTGQSNFIVNVPVGEYSWNIVVPAGAGAGTVAIQVKSNSTDTASGSYTIVPLAQLGPSLTIVSGNQQTGAPGASLAAPLVARLTDSGGNPIPGAPVSYAASPGAAAAASAVTDANGQISASLRLQPSTGIALLSVSAAGQTVTFGAFSSAKTITGFPTFTQINPQGGLIAALSAAILYYQNSSTLGAPNGLAAPAAIDQFLAANAGFTESETGTAIANPWVAMEFAGVAGGISVETPSLAHVLDLLNTGSPLVLELSVSVDGAAAGGAAADAIGINADGSIAIMDPNPAFGRASLSDYLNGFSAQGHNIQGSLAGVMRLAPALTAPGGFVGAAPASSAQSAASLSGACTNSIDIADPAAAGQAAPAKVGAVRFLECDGTQPVYQLSFGTRTGAAILDLAGGPALEIAAGTALAWQVTRVNGTLTIAPQTMAIAAVVNSAGFGPGLSPGGLFTIFGAGFTAGPAASSVTIDGQPAQVLAAFPFQVNARMPVGVAPGNAALQMNGPLGTATQNVTILSAAPGIFAILNQDGTLNSPSNPAARGAYVSIYGTGLGATTAQGSLQIALGEVTLTPSFAGLAPGLTGLYQINAQIPAGTTPGPAIALSVQEAGQTSNTVAVAVQ